MPLKHKGNMELRFRTVLWVILIIVMVGCFVVQMEEQLEKFIKKQTTVAVSFEGRETQRFPTFAFCDHRGYRMDMRFAATAARYNSTTFDVESEVILHGICEKDYVCGKKPKHTVRLVPTTYNGYCKVYEFLEEYPMRIYGGDTLYESCYKGYIIQVKCNITDFRMPSNRSYQVFLLEDGDEFSLVTQIFLKIQPTLTVTADTLIYISISMKKISSHNCKHVTARELSQCIMEKLQQNMTSLKLSCLPFQVYKMFPALHAKYAECEDEEVAMNYTERVSIQYCLS